MASLLGGPAIEISPATVRDEVLYLTKTTPTAVKWARPNPRTPLQGNMVVSFEASGDPRWRARVPLFGGTCPVRKCERKATIIQCERCHGFHSTRICIKAIRCSHCAATSHQTGDHPAKQCQSNDPHHQCPPRCANCLGPHPTTDIQCLLRPKQKNGVVTHPPREQTRDIRAEERLRAAAASGACLRIKDSPTRPIRRFRLRSQPPERNPPPPFNKEPPSQHIPGER